MSTDTAKEEHLTSCTDDLNNLHITQVDICACCGKEGSDLNICNKCQMVKYCNAACKKKHRTKHKKKCERRVAELHDIELFKLPPPKGDCLICMIPLPSLYTGSKYNTCCGKVICSGCFCAVQLRDKGVGLCPFCRSPTPNDEESVKRTKKRVEVGDANAIFSLGCNYSIGECGLPQDRAKALELWHRAGELGYAEAYFNIGSAYDNGRGVERDKRKADNYYELAAMRGDGAARHNLGYSEYKKSNWDRALKHWMISAGSGYNRSVKMIKQIYMDGHAKKEDYKDALLCYQNCIEEIRSEQRDNAAAYQDNYKYIQNS